MPTVLLFLAAYLLGGIPVGVLFARAQGIDLRKIGSGNIGATNVIRALGPRVGTIVFLLDVLKGLIPSVAARWVAPGHQEIWLYAGFFAVAGHCASPFLRFRGGKGISTALGGVLGAAPLTALSAFVLFAILLFIIRYMSLASIIGTASANIWGFVYGDALPVRVGFAVMTLFLVWRHKANIKRLMDGTEPKFSFTRSVPPPDPESEGADPQTSPEAGDGGEPPVGQENRIVQER
jgi:glycerol-3-phosphate acyltransferase PlsY